MKLNGAILSALVAIVAVVATVVGWTVVSRDNAERDLVNKRREQRLIYLVDAYHNIAGAANREVMSPKDVRRMEDAIMSVQLFGTKEQIKALTAVREENGDWTPALDALRGYIRKELDMPPAEQNLRFWRFQRKNTPFE